MSFDNCTASRISVLELILILTFHVSQSGRVFRQSGFVLFLCRTFIIFSCFRFNNKLHYIEYNGAMDQFNIFFSYRAIFKQIR